MREVPETCEAGCQNQHTTLMCFASEKTPSAALLCTQHATEFGNRLIGPMKDNLIMLPSASAEAMKLYRQVQGMKVN